MITALLFWLLPAPVYDERIGVEMAYVATTYVAPKPQCCGKCVNGKITHGDKHVTECPCPPNCVCKTKSVLKECETCAPAR